MEDEQMDPLSLLPEELLITILNSLPGQELARLNSVSKTLRGQCSISPLPVLKVKAPELEFEVCMDHFRDLLFRSFDPGLSFVDAMAASLIESPDLKSLFVKAMAESPIESLKLKSVFVDASEGISTSVTESFLDLMLGSPKLKSLFRSIPDLTFQHPVPKKFYRYLMFKSAKSVFPVVAAGSSLEHHKKHLDMAQLQLRVADNCQEETRSVAESLIEAAEERNVQKLDVRFGHEKLPVKCFTATALRILKLERCKLDITGRVDLPALRELHLDGSGDLQSIQNLLSSCPFLESLILFNIWSLKSLHVVGLPKLSRLEVGSCRRLTSMEIHVPALRHLAYISEDKCEVVTQVVLKNPESVRELKLKGDGIRDDSFLNLLSNLPNLEELELEDTKLQHLEISYPQLKHLTLWHQRPKHRESYFKIDAPKLQSFAFHGFRRACTYYMVSMNTSALQRVHIDVCDPDYCPIFINTLKDFFGKLNDSIVVQLSPESKLDFFFPTQEMLISSSPFYDIKHLAISVQEWGGIKCRHFGYIINQLLWMCHPKTLSIGRGGDPNFIRALYYKFMEKEDHPNCCIGSPIKCWRHYLKDVRVSDDESKEEIIRAFEKPKYSKSFIKCNVSFKLEWGAHSF